MLKQDDGEEKGAEVSLKALKGLEIKSFITLTFWKMLQVILAQTEASY